MEGLHNDLQIDFIRFSFRSQERKGVPQWRKRTEVSVTDCPTLLANRLDN